MRRSILFIVASLIILRSCAIWSYASDYVNTTDKRVEAACDDVINRLINWYGEPDEWDKFPVRFRQYQNNGVAGYTQYSGDTVSEVVVYFSLDKTVGGTLDHELTHAFLKFYLYREGLDLFLNEGVAQNSEVGRLNELRQAVYEQYTRGEFWHLDDLIGRNQYDDRLRMYRQSYSVIEMLTRLGGRDYLGAFLREYVKTDDFEACLAKYYGIKTTNELERRWIEYLNNGQEF